MDLKPIVFIDTEIEPKSGKVLDIGGVKGVGSSFHSHSLVDFAKFLYGSDYVCGHNIFNHDLKYIRNALIYAGIDDPTIIDTLFLSPLLFPAKPYHKLVKDDKLQTEDTTRRNLSFRKGSWTRRGTTINDNSNVVPPNKSWSCTEVACRRNGKEAG